MRSRSFPTLFIPSTWSQKWGKKKKGLFSHVSHPRNDAARGGGGGGGGGGGAIEGGNLIYGLQQWTKGGETFDHSRIDKYITKRKRNKFGWITLSVQECCETAIFWKIGKSVAGAAKIEKGRAPLALFVPHSTTSSLSNKRILLHNFLVLFSRTYLVFLVQSLARSFSSSLFRRRQHPLSPPPPSKRRRRACIFYLRRSRQVIER